MKLTAILEAVAPPEQPMRQVSSQELMKLIGKGKANAMMRHPWFQEISNYEKAYKYGVTSWGGIEVEAYAFYRQHHTTPEGKIRPELMMRFIFMHTGTKVHQVRKYYRPKEPSEMEKRYGPSAGWRHMKDWKAVDDAVKEGGLGRSDSAA